MIDQAPPDKHNRRAAADLPRRREARRMRRTKRPPHVPLPPRKYAVPARATRHSKRSSPCRCRSPGQAPPASLIRQRPGPERGVKGRGGDGGCVRSYRDASVFSNRSEIVETLINVSFIKRDEKKTIGTATQRKHVMLNKTCKLTNFTNVA